MSTKETQAVVCVFCGSYPGTSPAHLEAARALAQQFHEHGVQLVYGGGTVGIMGELARTLVALSGPQAVQGIIPRALVRVEEGYKTPTTNNTINGNGGAVGPHEGEGKAPERAGEALGETTEYGQVTVVADMHTRKRLMAQRVLAGGPGSGFVALAGGFGTMEELMEVTTWNQLGIHKAGVVLLNINGYWDGVLAWVQTAVAQGFVSRENAGILAEARRAEDVLRMLREYRVSSDRMALDWGQE
ncbi:LOG family protein [Aspergillus homomorphus CBS 101889]|uniref:Lysine decarboxylase-like protein n=1 Tax=Aspergillus homomorphus (strain CBS 101889) TaxID=1450537 RepID=A0A395HJX5_ASPHC|nr:hypothetical protein BO97DRAFT_446507 [Aspergillus homomorphus CBS 101889]RAL07916.1 hypothetical protein BO97DRAFT_446507 [Aspergillus homomorphus CBS 101889]